MKQVLNSYHPFLDVIELGDLTVGLWVHFWLWQVHIKVHEMDLNRAHQSSVGHYGGWHITCVSHCARPQCPMLALLAVVGRWWRPVAALMTTLTLSITHCTHNTQPHQHTPAQPQIDRAHLLANDPLQKFPILANY